MTTQTTVLRGDATARERMDTMRDHQATDPLSRRLPPPLGRVGDPICLRCRVRETQGEGRAVEV